MPPGTMRMWPSSAPAPNPPRKSRSPATIAPPTPVPIVSITMSLTSRPAPKPELGPAGGVRVVVDDDGGADAGLELLAERLVAPVDVRGVVHGRLRGVDEACRGDADRRGEHVTESDSIMADRVLEELRIARRGGHALRPDDGAELVDDGPGDLRPPMSIPIACTRKPPFEG